ncbi:hypothetical protein COCVIDRAFT_38329 [Bipolaris victoriae FI3]|uniref:Uncharacterized protein n=1 Tax=Bipolaris victoriae (strain FI3) TaxID=930091 RepID=W7E7V2_BIPV3|nr:hypothetical protein COCVIDRAFT_38329 [Bipolaris victoriae FI3]
MGRDTRRQYSSSHQCFCSLPSRGLHVVVTIAVLPVAPLLHARQRHCPIVRPGVCGAHVGRPPAKVALRGKTKRAMSMLNNASH